MAKGTLPPSLENFIQETHADVKNEAHANLMASLMPLTEDALPESVRTELLALWQRLRVAQQTIETENVEIADVKVRVAEILDEHRALNVKGSHGTWSRSTITAGGRLRVDSLKLALGQRGIPADVVVAAIEEATEPVVKREGAPQFRAAKEG